MPPSETHIPNQSLNGMHHCTWTGIEGSLWAAGTPVRKKVRRHLTLPHFIFSSDIYWLLLPIGNSLSRQLSFNNIMFQARSGPRSQVENACCDVVSNKKLWKQDEPQDSTVSPLHLSFIPKNNDFKSHKNDPLIIDTRAKD